MRVTSETKYADFQPVERFVTDEQAAKIAQAAEQYYCTPYDLTFAEFHACSRGDFSNVLGHTEEPTVLQVYWCKAFAKFCKDFAEQLQKLQLPPTPEQERAQSGLLQVDFHEGCLLFIRQYFGLQSFREAEKITIGELYIAKRDAYNTEKFRRNYNKIIMQKNGHNK